MFRRSGFRKSIILSAVASLVMMLTPSAHAALFTGVCVVSVTFDFHTPVRATGSAPSYDVSLSPGAVDFSPQQVSGWEGTQPCLVTLDALEPARDTAAIGTGSSTSWTCGATVAAGDWQQDWADQDGFNSPPSLFGQHFIAGTWGDWTLTLTNPQLNYTGVAELTAAPFDHLKLQGCANGNGFTRLTMIGVLEFQDP